MATSCRLGGGHFFGGRKLGRHDRPPVVSISDDRLQNFDGQFGHGGSADGCLSYNDCWNGPAQYWRVLQLRHRLAEW